MKLNFWQYTTIAAVIIILLLAGCNACQNKKIARLEKDCAEKLVRVDTLVLIDTISVAFNTPVYVPQSYRIEIPVPVYVDTSDQSYLPVDTANILKDYYATRYYSDKQNVKDSSGNIVGNVTINDQVSQNKIKQRQVLGEIQKIIITNNIVKTIEAPQNNKVFFGLQGNYFTWNKELSPSASLLFLHKKDWGVEAGAGLLNDKLFYQTSFKLKIKL
jgi:hypothetical protein